jgi:acyl-CoA-binding protein
MPEHLAEMSSNAKLTFYSLFKQVNEGDADEMPGAQESTDKVK